MGAMGGPARPSALTGGTPARPCGTTATIRILWQGWEYSWKTGLYYFRARWYDPIVG